MGVDTAAVEARNGKQCSVGIFAVAGVKRLCEGAMGIMRVTVFVVLLIKYRFPFPLRQYTGVLLAG